MLLAAGCMVGPHYRGAGAPTAPEWLDAADPRLRCDAPADPRWWTAFGDPVLTRLVDDARARNPTLESAGLRVVQALARRGIAIGNLYPQQQEATAAYTHTIFSLNTPTLASAGSLAGGSRALDNWQLGFDTAWEVDLWGRFRRGIEASDADLLASLATYDDVLVSLEAQIASTYIQERVLEARLAIAHDNVVTQRDSLDIAQVRFEAGGTSDLDVQQALTLLRDTQATIPALEAQRRQATDLLSALVGDPGRVPDPPATVAVGIPADLIARRPDVRAAERAAAAQSARIGVAFA